MNPLKLNTTSVSLAVTPTVVSTLLSHYLNRQPLKQKPTAHLSYDEGLHLVRSFLQFASHHTVEELQAFTAQWVPHPQWVRVDEITIADQLLEKAAALLQAELGEEGIARVGGRQWWQWRRPKSPLKAEWIEMKAHYQERKKNGDPGKRVMLYVHGGAYFFGSVDEHRYQMQRHARKLKARVFAPKYRLAPQFPFPCGLQDCIAAYLYLLTIQEPNTIILAGDSAGGGMVMSMLCTLRDQGIPLPAGAILISPWVDLTHSFPSVAGDTPFDYIPTSGFHHKPSRAWPPPNEDDLAMMEEQAAKTKKGVKGAAKPSTLEAKQGNPFELETPEGHDAQGDPIAKPEAPLEADVPKTSVLLSVTINGKLTTVKDQIQMYTTNQLIDHPLVSPVTQPTLGGLPPLLIMVGGGEVLRDEQIYLAHKCANPTKYAPPDEKMNDADREKLNRYKPTDVQLQVWDDLCHVAPTLSFTRPAKYMYRSIAQFGAWALARAQQVEIDILDDDDISVISSSGSDTDQPQPEWEAQIESAAACNNPLKAQIGKAGDTLPPFKGHMIRQRVTRHGGVYNLEAPSELASCTMDKRDIGVAKEIPVRRWLETKARWDSRYSSAKTKVHQQIVKDIASGFVGCDGETPPPTALAGRRKVSAEQVDNKKKRSLGLALWSLWGSKHDEMTVEREQKADQRDAVEQTTATQADRGVPMPSNVDGEADDATLAPPTSPGRPRSRSRTVVDEHQTSQQSELDDRVAPVDALIELRREAGKNQREEAGVRGNDAGSPGMLSPTHVPSTVVAGKRPFIDGYAMPFSLGKDADTASMLTLQSTAAGPNVRPMSPLRTMSNGTDVSDAAQNAETSAAVKRLPFRLGHDAETASMMTLQSTAPAPDARSVSPIPPTSAADAGTRPEPEVEVAGKRPFVNGLAVPFSLGKEADTASMMTLQSTAPVQDVRSADPMPPAADKGTNSRPVSEHLDAATPMAAGPASAYATPMVELGRPQMERDMFVTAAEDLPMAASAGR
ncbi:hypothetical protein VD0002_g3818 [Verticillium dahliae]|nr:hypothetical protein VD0002_g3818 [Verticillium dahliae]